MSTLPAAAEIVVKDDRNWEVKFEKPATRVLALYGALNEIFLAMGLDRLLVGRTMADENIPELKNLPVVGTHMRPNPEIIVGLKPDVVLQMAGRKEAEALANGLGNVGIPVLIFQMDSFEDIFSVIERIGTLTGEQERAEILSDSLRQRLALVATSLYGTDRPAVFYEVRYPNLLGAGAESIMSDIITSAGGRNVVAYNGKIARLSEEELIRLNPEVYVVQQGYMNPAPRPVQDREHFRTLRAVRDKRILEVEEAVFARPGPKAVDAVEKLARYLHPTVKFVDTLNPHNNELKK